MKFSAVLVATVLAAPQSAGAFAPSRPAAVAARTLPLGAATLDATTATAPVNGAVQVEAESAAIVEKDWAVADFVKDSDRVLP